MRTITNISNITDNSGTAPIVTYSNAVQTFIRQDNPPRRNEMRICGVVVCNNSCCPFSNCGCNNRSNYGCGCNNCSCNCNNCWNNCHCGVNCCNNNYHCATNGCCNNNCGHNCNDYSQNNCDECMIYHYYSREYNF